MPPFFFRNLEAPGSPGIDTDLAHIGDAAASASLDEARIGADDLLDHQELLDLDHGALIGKFFGSENPLFIEGYPQADYPNAANREDVGARVARKSFTEPKCADSALRLLQKL